jgi:hypothetical protein
VKGTVVGPPDRWWGGFPNYTGLSTPVGFGLETCIQRFLVLWFLRIKQRSY